MLRVQERLISADQFSRSDNACMKRMQVIKSAVSKFCGFFSDIEQLGQAPSGYNIEKHIEEAQELYLI